MADITYIPIRQLHPHPDNPRKELGDLSELGGQHQGKRRVPEPDGHSRPLPQQPGVHQQVR